MSQESKTPESVALTRTTSGTTPESDVVTIPAATSSGEAPPVQMLVYAKDTLTDFKGPFDAPDFKAERIHSIEGVRSKIAFTPSGNMFAVAFDNCVRVYDSDTFTSLIELPDLSLVRTIKFSPKGTYLQTFTAYTKDVQENLIIWHLPTRTAVAKYVQKLEPEIEIIQWTQDESMMCKLGQNELQVYNGGNIAAGVAKTISLPGLKAFQISPISDPPVSAKAARGAAAASAAATGSAAAAGTEGAEESKTSKPVSYVALFAPPAQGGGRPGLIAIYSLETSERTAARITGFKVTDCVFSWNSTGTAILARTSTEVAEEGNYYGESLVFFLTYDGRQDVTLTFGANVGPVQDVCWCPRSYSFATLQGEARNAKAVIWGARDVKPLKELGSGPWNTIRYSPSGRFVALAGVGNLAGQIEIWDKTKLLRLAAFQDADSPRSLEFSPCGRYFITATIFPHLRVSNQLKIWTYYGKLIYQERFEQLRECIARPVPQGVYQERPPSPEVLRKAQEAATAPPPAPVKKAYVPPHLRNSTSASSSSYTAAAVAGIGSGGANRSGARDLTKSTPANTGSTATQAAARPQQQYYSPAEQMMREYQEQARREAAGGRRK